ncbi:tetrahydromethanopterin S-methyltransferase subunit A [uncultured Methanocorpusculum sp.]|nr:tetrahydromethanopterin S-methyltransferase subunit A [uncultured Methanocorpusculum sp.]MDD4423031.1 tetrahydromethanopterin S-methyltransferase subunit A [Methanocorpusculum parvum]
MADKKSPANGWPIIQGDYHTGDANSPVAVITMGSHLDEAGICAAGAALAGSCKTENLGIEKVVANVISNPNIRFVLLCGTEVKGHLSGQSIEAMHKNGVEGGKIVGSTGAIPFLENLTAEHIKRFQEQIELVNIMETEDMGQISAKINELKGRDPGAFAADPIVIQLTDDAGGSEGGATVASANPQFLEIEKRLDAIEQKIEFTDAEIAMRVGRKIGRDIGILYGLVAGIIAFLVIIYWMSGLLFM